MGDFRSILGPDDISRESKNASYFISPFVLLNSRRKWRQNILKMNANILITLFRGNVTRKETFLLIHLCLNTTICIDSICQLPKTVLFALS